MSEKMFSYTDTIKETDGLVLYTDGSAKPNPGKIGWGVHGYSYSLNNSIKGAGLLNHVPTIKGYVNKKDFDNKNNKLTVLSYFDAYGSHNNQGSNNLAELLAVKEATNIAKLFKPKNVLIKTDSEYVNKGYNEWSHIWVKNNWIKSDGNPVQNSNEWKFTLDNINNLINNGTNLKIEWVKGHDSSLGNNIADKLAGIGSNSGAVSKTINFSLANKKYWEPDLLINPLLKHRYCYFYTNKTKRGVYYLGDHGKDASEFGQKVTSTSYCVLYLKTHDPVIEDIRNYQSKLNNGEFLYQIFLNNILNTNQYKDLFNYSTSLLIARYKDNRPIGLKNNDGDLIVDELYPPRKSFKGIEILSFLENVLLEYIELSKNKDKQTNYTITNITESIYNSKENKKTNKFLYELKEDFKPGCNSVNIKVNLKDQIRDINLILGSDLPCRNSLKKLEGENVNIDLISWSNGENIFRFAVVVRYNEDIGIWSGFYSNYLFC